MGVGQSMAIQQASMSDLADAITPEEAEAHDVRRLRWILRVANNPGSCEEWYLGDERDGVRHGHGAAFFTSGDVYLGEWHRGAWHGRGTLTHMSGAKYTGHFEKGEQHGTGEFVDVDGVRFRGEYRRGTRHGAGFMESPNGARFEGWFRDGVAHGDGILTWPDGGKFIGKYVHGKEHGRGAILDPLGCKVCDVECAAGVLVGGRTVCPGSLGGGKGPKCRGGSQSCGFCLQTALDLELSIANEDTDALEVQYEAAEQTKRYTAATTPLLWMLEGDASRATNPHLAPNFRACFSRCTPESGVLSAECCLPRGADVLPFSSAQALSMGGSG
ncbi:unnamed protein product, partial [Scytosiphon promiscuus]